MPKAQTNGQEQTFCTKFSASSFVAYVNTSIELGDVVERDLREALQDLFDEIKGNKDKKFNVIIDLDTDQVDGTLYKVDPNLALDRRLWRLSRFFQEIKKVVVVVKKTTIKMMLHTEREILRTAATVDPLQLDTFNRYVLLHLIPYVRKSWIEAIKDENAARMTRIVEEVVHDKLNNLRRDRKQTVTQ